MSPKNFFIAVGLVFFSLGVIGLKTEIGFIFGFDYAIGFAVVSPMLLALLHSWLE